MAESFQGPEASLTYVWYNLKSVTNVGVFRNCFALPIHMYKEEGEEFIVVHLTAQENKALCKVCYMTNQKEVWHFPSYEFVVYKDSLSIV